MQLVHFAVAALGLQTCVGERTGIGEKYHPIPWAELDYDPSQKGYVVSFTPEQLKAAPSDSIDAVTQNDGLAFRDRAYRHYGTTPYWH